MDKATVDAYAERYHNWGRWGEDDEVGTLNFVTAERVAAACALVRRGKTFNLALSLDANGPQRPWPGNVRFNPIHTMLKTGTDMLASEPQGTPFEGDADDMLSLPLQCATQWDGLAHYFHRGKMYNGRSAGLVTSRGAEANGIEKMAGRVTGRGVLLDIPRSKGVDWLDISYAVTPDDLDRCLSHQGTRVESGDFVLVRTGHQTLCESTGNWEDYARSLAAPGLSFTTIPWLHANEVAALATDTVGAEVRPSEVDGVASPWHAVAIANMGLLVGEMFSLDELAQDCAEDGAYAFLFVAPPLPVTGAVGSPMAALAIK